MIIGLFSEAKLIEPLSCRRPRADSQKDHPDEDQVGLRAEEATQDILVVEGLQVEGQVDPLEGDLVDRPDFRGSPGTYREGRRTDIQKDHQPRQRRRMTIPQIATETQPILMIREMQPELIKCP